MYSSMQYTTVWTFMELQNSLTLLHTMTLKQDGHTNEFIAALHIPMYVPPLE